MLYILTSKVSLEPLETFRFLSEVEIESSWKNLTDKCTLKFPRNVKFQKMNLREVLKNGQTGKIELGYNWDFITEFEGYITRIKPELQFEIMFEDAMWQLKQTTFSGSYSKVSLKQLIADLMEKAQKDRKMNFRYDVLCEMSLGKMRIEKVSVAEVLKELKDKYGIYSFFREGILKIGLPHIEGFQYNNGKAPIKFGFQHNIAANNLEYIKKEDRKIKVKAISILGNNKKIETEAGDPDGEVHTFYRYGIETEKELKIQVENEIAGLKRDGYKGSFTAFGMPYVHHGDSVELFDYHYPERQGIYKCEGTKITFGRNGFRREITLGTKIS